MGSGEPKVKEIAATLAPTTLKTFLNSSNRRGEGGMADGERRGAWGCGSGSGSGREQKCSKGPRECDGTGTGSGVGVERDLRSNWAG